MLIPRFWAKTNGSATDASGKQYAFQLWGWSQESVADALGAAQRRLRDVAARVTKGEVGNEYFYGKQPLREEIIRIIGEPGGGEK